MIVTPETLRTFKRCGLVGGVFDPLHGGHIAYLRAAKAYDLPLVCAVSAGGERHPPLVPLVDRLAIVDALKMVFAVVPAGESMVPTLEMLRPAAYIKGEDWRGRLPGEEIEVCDRLDIGIIYTPTKVDSSTDLLAKYTREINRKGIEAFERFVHAQAPPQKWEPVTDYSLEARREAEGQHPQLILDTFLPSLILDAGCGRGHLVQLLQEAGAEHVIGFDLEDGFDLTSDLIPTSHYDLVICREVLEHLTVRGIRQAVRNLARLSSKFIYLTTRFAEKPRHLFDVQDHDDLDPTHISMFPKELLRSWFVAEGCRSRPDLEAKMDWQNKGRVMVFEVA